MKHFFFARGGENFILLLLLLLTTLCWFSVYVWWNSFIFVIILFLDGTVFLCVSMNLLHVTDPVSHVTKIVSVQTKKKKKAIFYSHSMLCFDNNYSLWGHVGNLLILSYDWRVIVLWFFIFFLPHFDQGGCKMMPKEAFYLFEGFNRTHSRQ